MDALSLALSVLTQLPSLISAGVNVIALVKNTEATITKAQAENRDPSPDEWLALNTQIEALRAQLHQP